MESIGNFFSEEWHGLNRMFMENEESDQLNKQGLITSQSDIGLNFELSNMFLCASDNSSNGDSYVVDEEHLLNVSDQINPNYYHFLSQENNISSSGATNDMCDTSIQYFMMDEITNSSLPSQVFLDADTYLQHDVILENSLKRKLETADVVEDEVNNEISDKSRKKRTRVSRENKNNKNVKSKKTQKRNETEDGNNINDNGERNEQTSSSCSYNDKLNESQENTNVNPNAKARASRGTATDPQSLYARKRRERINERLRILQNLVPNGTKVDISTMLEEAVEYVKFLKLQIQLLSSDDTWMYAPIAYNGMDMGLYPNFRPTQ